MSDISLTPDSIATRNEDVLYSEVADGMSLMDIESGRYFHFEATGARIWLSLSPGTTFGQLCANLGSEFEVEPEQCEQETHEFISELPALGLVEIQR